eukprot:GFYU01013226.1.p1 GENE.GFYU01013226.1~~GFYU01013226.1.p1  ORF type:complete len:317 (-),score=98.30 GFYU01013226.1:153-971(-)
MSTQSVPSRDLSSARDAYAVGDVEASKAAHAAQGAPENHKSGGGHIKSVVYGGLDGIITTFAVVASIAGAELSAEVVLIMGFANLIADGISMGFGDYLSSEAENSYIKAERRREAWEVENNIEGEIQEMVEIYVEKGIPEEDAIQVMEILSKHKEAFVDIMMVEELGLMPPDEDDSPALSGLITFVSFMVFGVIPLLAYLSTSWASDNPDTTFMIACFLTAGTLFALGAAKGQFIGEQWWRAGGLMLFNGALAAAAAYLIGWGVSEATGFEA